MSRLNQSLRAQSQSPAMVWVKKLQFIRPMVSTSYLSALDAQIWCTPQSIRCVYIYNTKFPHNLNLILCYAIFKSILFIAWLLVVSIPQISSTSLLFFFLSKMKKSPSSCDGINTLRDFKLWKRVWHEINSFRWKYELFDPLVPKYGIHSWIFFVAG